MAMDMGIIRMHPASTSAQQLSVTAPMATMAVVTLMVMDSPMRLMIARTAASLGVTH